MPKIYNAAEYEIKLKDVFFTYQCSTKCKLTFCCGVRVCVSFGLECCSGSKVAVSPASVPQLKTRYLIVKKHLPFQTWDTLKIDRVNR